MVLSIRLIVEPGPHNADGAVFLLTGQDGLVGRDPHCDLVIESGTVSGRHGMLKAGGAGYEYTDLDSSNGSALLRGGAAEPTPLPAGAAVPLMPGDTLLLGAADSPVRIRIEAGAAPYEAGPRTERTILASAPLSNLMTTGNDALVALSARAISAETPQALAETALHWLKKTLPRADAHSVLVTGSGFSASAGDTPPTGLAREAASRKEVVIFEESGEQLPMTESIARGGLRAAVVAPLVAKNSWHGLLAAWTTQGAGALPKVVMESLAVAAPLVALSAAPLAVREEGEQERRRLEAENKRLRGAEAKDPQIVDPIGSSPPFLQAIELCRTVAPANVAVLLLGETGTGKEVLAQAVHRWSPRAKEAFVAFNCAAVPENLLESELFGHVRGAITGPNRAKKGLF